MDDRMRDLDQLQEYGPDERGRRIGTFIMTGCFVALVAFAVGLSLRHASPTRDDVHDRDPLDQLDRLASPASPASNPASAVTHEAHEPQPIAKLDATKLTFERELTEHEERPEVLAALEAAAREEQTLATDRNAATAAEPKPRATPDDTAAQPVDAAPDVVARRAATEDEEYLQQLEQLREERVPRALPAGVAASAASHKLARAAHHDKLVAQALPKPGAPQTRARAGEDGEFTLQVISYDTQAAAQAFANGLRAKGHESFVVSGDVDGRGRYYRVRIGPFKTKPQAETYRHTFETQERMNTIVVKRVSNE
jgi:DedD protein